MTMTLVSTVTVGSGGAASIDFTSIPQTGTDLLILVSGRATSGSGLWLSLNGTNGTNRNWRNLEGSGSSVASYNSSADAFIGYNGNSAYTANTFGSHSIYIPNYAGSTNKSISSDGVNENNATAATQNLLASLWANTAAITSISLTTGGNFAQYSTASLYTITKGSGGATVS